jgi:hypothetical protein
VGADGRGSVSMDVWPTESDIVEGGTEGAEGPKRDWAAQRGLSSRAGAESTSMGAGPAGPRAAGKGAEPSRNPGVGKDTGVS